MAASIDPSAILGQLIESFIKLPLAQKILFPVLLVASAAGIVYVSQWASRADYSVLYSDLEPADASAVVERLKEQKIAYQVRGDGSTIAVSPPELVHELRLSLASEGVPKGGKVGFEIFDTSALGTTSFVEKLKFMRALQGELERTIVSLDAVTSARVHITQPEKSVFAKDENMATASVMLRLRPGGELDKNQIRGISSMVAGSVEGLAVEQVTIVDVYGNLLSYQDEGEDSLGAEATRLQYQRGIEKEYVRRIEAMLTKVLGPGKASARVNVDLDFSYNEREEESYDPGGIVVRSERSVEESMGQSQRGGVPGVVSNLDNDTQLLSPPGSSDSGARKEQVKNYEVSRAVSKTVSPRGKLVRLSAAVLVDGTYTQIGEAAEGESPKMEFEPLEPEVMRQIENVVKTAVGYDPVRGDNVTVENVPFFVPDQTLANKMDELAQKDFILNSISKAVPVVFILLLFLVVVRPMVKFLITPTEAELDLSRLLPTGIEELEAELDVERNKAQVPTYEPAVDIEQLEELMAENSRMVKENPQQAALLIRYWLNDGRL